MAISLIHTPEGVRDIYGEECAGKEEIASRIYEVFHRFGYSSIQTPSYEFFDIFNRERGSVPSNQTFKFFDRDGNTLVLRPDITPSIARCAAKYFSEEDIPVRLCYQGNTFINNVSFRGGQGESTVLGAEMFGDPSSDADAEMLAMLIKSLLSCGLKDFQVEVGEVSYSGSLIQETGFSGEEQAQLRFLLEQKNDFGLAELLDEKNVPEKLKKALLAMPTLFGGPEVLERAASLTENDGALNAILHLNKLYDMLGSYGVSSYISFDLGMPAKFSYYTGIIFKAYTYGTGLPIASGGRYDRLLAQFGKDSPATGFLISLDPLLAAMSRQGISAPLEKNTILLYERSQRSLAIRMAEEEREKGRRIILMKRFREKNPEDYLACLENRMADRLIYLDEEGASRLLYPRSEEGNQ